MTRDDLIGAERAPEAIEKLLARIAGRNPYGEPNYRYVLAHLRVCKQAAQWHDWDDNLSIQERGGMVTDDLGNRVMSDHSPNRVVTEMRTISRYPICECPDGVLHVQRNKTGEVVRSWREDAGDCEECSGVRGWIIERWWPAAVVAGDKETWEKDRIDGMPRRGPYPEFGAYKRVGKSKATAKIPSARQIEDLLTYLAYTQENTHLTEAQFRREFEIASEYEQQRLRAAQKEATREKIKDALSPMAGSSLAAGREREKYARRLRERGIHIGHVGA